MSGHSCMIALVRRLRMYARILPMKPSPILLACVLLISVLPGTSHGSGSVDPANCSYDPLVVGNSSGNGITLPGHGYAGYRVIVHDDENLPMNDMPVTLAFDSGNTKLY